MTKNISVIDMQGNVYEATYPKRAKGLVKKGRARFVNESTICLACPPYQTEDNEMDINESNNNTYDVSKIAEATSGAFLSNEKDRQDNEKNQYLRDILQHIGAILQDTRYIEAALEQLGNVMDSDEALDRIGDIVCAREGTNQKAIEALGKLADKLIS